MIQVDYDDLLPLYYPEPWAMIERAVWAGYFTWADKRQKYLDSDAYFDVKYVRKTRKKAAERVMREAAPKGAWIGKNLGKRKTGVVLRMESRKGRRRVVL